MPQQAAGRFEPGAPSQVCMMDGGSCSGRAKRQRSNSGAGKGVKAVLAAGSKGSVSYFGPPPGGIRAGRPRPTRQAGESPSAPSVWCALAEGSMWAERPGVLPGFPVRHPGGMGTNTTRIWSRASSPEAARPKGTPIHSGARGWGLDVRRVVPCAGSIPAGRKYAKGVHTDGIFPGNV